MKICYFGTFYTFYQRNRIIREGLKRNGIEVILCHCDYSWVGLVYLKLLYQWLFFTDKNIDAIVVGETGYIIMPLAKLIGLIWAKPVILDAFFSVYQSEVYDRKTAREYSLASRKTHLIEETGMLITPPDRVTG